jgi:hypothetical protein
MFGLIGERIGGELPPVIMAPAPGIIPWLKIQDKPEPSREDLKALETSIRTTILQPSTNSDTEEIDLTSVQNLCYVPKAWAAYFLAPITLMQPQLRAAGHPFFPTLHEWGTEGVPVDCGPDWSWDVIEHAVERGPHRSAMEKENIALVHEDVQYQVDAGFSRIVLWSDLQELRPSKLKISPMAVVPQKDRRGRLILDLSFPVYPERTKSQ